MTFKAPPAAPDREFKIREELEVEVADFNTTRKIMEKLGLTTVRIYEKWRETFALGDTKLLVDTMPYGPFLEIEGAKSAIRKVSDQLGLTWEERILLNYVEIFEVIRREENLPFYDITFDHFQKTGKQIEITHRDINQ